MTQPRNTIGQFAADVNSRPELELDLAGPDVEGLRATVQDFLEGSLPGFGFTVRDVDAHVDSLIESLVYANTSTLNHAV